MRVTHEELTDALNRARVTVRDPKGLCDLALGPGTSLQLGAQVTEAKGGVKWPDETAEWLLSSIESHRAAEGDPPVTTDPEIALMAAILHGMEQLDKDAQRRIRNWVDERFTPTRLFAPQEQPYSDECPF